ncbi:NAD(P)H-dependent oxidoreductase [Streptomyces sp. NPDC052101]|uniref:FMN-dependent NADH-azoreductase n=1 Tax=Streptomyces sp. NPDC052101 TaxID=3155763 RepID=UPI003427F45D
MNLFRMDTSIMPSMSASSELADIVEAEWKAAHPDGSVTRRHLGTHPIPADAWPLATLSRFLPEDQLTPGHRDALALADELAAELRAADAVLLAVPLYNYGVSQHFKAWVDMIVHTTGNSGPALKGVPTVLVTVRGGGYGPGTPREGWDHSTPFLTRVLADMWQADLTLVERELTLAGIKPEMEQFRELADDLHTRAREAAQQAGRALAIR